MTNKLVLLVGLASILASFWVTDSFAIQLADTYYVIGWGLVLRSIGLLCCLAGGLPFLWSWLVTLGRRDQRP